MARVADMWTVTVVIIPPTPMDELARIGAAVLVEDAAMTVDDSETLWFTRITEESRAGVEMHGLAAGEREAVIRDRWMVMLRELIADSTEMNGWKAEVTVSPEDDTADEDEDLALPTPVGTTDTPDRLVDSIRSAADSFRGLRTDLLLPSDFDDLRADDRAAALSRATHLAGCLIVGADILTDQLFDDIQRLREAHDQRTTVDVDGLWVLSGLPARFAKHYGPLFAQRFLVAFTDMTRRLTAGWEPLANVAQELAVRLLLNEVEALADTADLELPPGWRGHLEYFFLFYVDHVYLHDRASDGFEDDPGFGPGGMAPMRFDDWFVPFNDERHLPVYVNDHGARRRSAE